MYSVAAALYDRVNNTEGVSTMVNNVLDIFASSLDDNTAPYDDWDAGRSGLLYASPFLNRNVPNYKLYVLGDVDASVIPRDLMTSIAVAVVNRGNTLSDSPGMLIWIDTCYIMFLLRIRLWVVIISKFISFALPYHLHILLFILLIIFLIIIVCSY